LIIEFEWQKPLPLRRFSEKDEQRICEELDNEPGIYVFARRWGAGFEPLYVGQAQRMSARVKQQFNNHRLIQHIQDSKIGAKVLLVGYLKHSGNTNVKKALDKAERAFIRYCVSQNHAIHNKLGTKIRVDDFVSVGGRAKTAFPRSLGVED
jgi:hypothetical protein